MHCHALLQRIYPTQGSNPHLLHCRQIINPLSHFSSVQFSSAAQSCPTLCNPMNHSTPGLPVHHKLLESTQTHVHRVGNAIQPSHPLLSPSPPAPNPSHHQGLFQWVSSLHQVAKVLEFQLQHQSFQWTPNLRSPKTNILMLYSQILYLTQKLIIFSSELKNWKHFCELLKALWALGTAPLPHPHPHVPSRVLRPGLRRSPRWPYSLWLSAFVFPPSKLITDCRHAVCKFKE